MAEYKKYIDNYSTLDKLKRLFWNVTSAILFRPFGTPIFKNWRILILRLFGAKIGEGSIVHSSCQIWAPWNLVMGKLSCIGPNTIIYNPGKIIIGSKVTISQYAYLCTAAHDYTSPLHTLYWKSIIIDDYAWVAANAFVSPGVHIGHYAIIGACSVLTKDAEPWGIYAGNPAKYIKKRILKDEKA